MHVARWHNGPMSMKRVRFGPFEADLEAGELRRDGTLLPLQDLPFRLLAALVERPGEVIARADLTARLWGSETFVDAVSGLNTAVAKLRVALDDDPERPVYVETVPKRGYRFIAKVEGVGETRKVRRRTVVWVAGALALVVVGGFALIELGAQRKNARVAVVLFDNETEEPALSRLAQGLTDATVFGLTAEPRLAVIGNAAVLRSERPFRDMEAIRDALDADFIVIGQVQTVDGAVIVRAHLIRASDLAHVWVDTVEDTARGETELLSTVAARITAAVTTHTGL